MYSSDSVYASMYEWSSSIVFLCILHAEILALPDIKE